MNRAETHAENAGREAIAAAREAAGSARDTVSHEIAALRERVETLLAQRVTPTVNHLMDRAEHVASDAAASVRHQTARVSETVQERPLAALGVAALLGFIAAMLVRR